MRRLLLFVLTFMAQTLPATESNPPVSAIAAPDAAALTHHARAAETELREHILPFWLAHARDQKLGGFHGEIDNELAVNPAAPRGLLLTARILWTFSAAYRRYQDPAYLEMARWAYADLTGHFLDREHGGFYWSLNADLSPLETRKQTYGQVFAIYGLSEYARATGETAARDLAIQTYQLLNKHTHDRQLGGFLETATRDWCRPAQWDAHIMGVPTAKSQNTNLHVMEAFTALLRIWPDDSIRQSLREMIEIMLERILDPQTHHLVLFLDQDWRPQGDSISYGHDIEVSWLLVEAAEVLGEPDLLARVRRESVAIAEATLASGVDPADGGIFNEGNPAGVTDRSKDWWPQAEAVVGFLNAYQLTGETRYFQASQRTWAFIETRLCDRVHGEWFWSADPSPTRRARHPKAGFWKCPYHNARACLELIERLEHLAGSQSHLPREKHVP